MPKRKQLPDREIVEAYRQGVSQQFLAQYFEVHVATIRNRLRAAGAISSSIARRKRLAVQGPNAWLNALTEDERLRIEHIVLHHQKYEEHLRYMMSHIGGPGYPARQRGTRGATRRDEESRVLDVRTKDIRDDLYRGMPKATKCRRSLDGGRTWSIFDPPPAIDRRPKTHFKNNFRRDASRELQSQGLITRKESP